MKCEKEVKLCNGPAIWHVTLTRLETYFDSDTESENMCEPCFAAYLTENEIDQTAFIHEGWAFRIMSR